MRLSIFNDEIGIDITDGISHFRDWGLEWIDLRGRVMGREFCMLEDKEMDDIARLLKDHGLKVACLQSSLAKVHLPEAERLDAEKEKLEGIIRAADRFDCRLIRAFFYWQPKAEAKGALAVQPDQLQKVLDQVAPLTERAKEAGLTLAFENCGVTVPECLTVLDALGVPEWGLAWDCANEWLGGEPPDDKQIAERVKRSRCVHVKARGAVPGLADVTVPWEKILLALATGGFKGPVSAETHNPDKSVSNVEMSKRLIDRIRQAWPGGAPAPKVKAEFDFEPVKFVVVGLGMGYSRAKQLKKEPGTELLGVVDLNAEKAEKVGAELECEWTTELDPWLERDDAEAVFVMTPTGLHADIAIAALEAGKHVITTKPMEASLEACDRMIEAADKAGKILAVDFAFRLEHATQRLKQRIANGDLGKLLGGTLSLRVLRKMEYFQAGGGWRGTRKLDGGGIMSNQSIHHIDELVYILGTPRRVSLHKWTQAHDIEAEDLGCAVWEYEDGSVVQIFATTSYPVSTWYRDLELHGTEGAVTHITGGPYSAPIERWHVGGNYEDAPPEPEMLPWSNLAQNLAAAIRTGAELVCDGRDGRRSRLVLDRMYESADKDGAWVEV
ncbi:MAG: Gfo/Idh/MocA family oxidoreductase [Planctomycetes bacterium]|nr:Gfo/Idh/MocA family oxidoreductase [Planctomycetota bacterium]